jgi:hypothetical protein
MKTVLLAISVIALAGIFIAAAPPQGESPSGSAASGMSQAAPSLPPDEIIRRFAAKEKEFKKARDNYTYTQTVKVQELDEDGNIGGQHQLVEDVIFTPAGKRIEKVTFAPLDTLRKISLSPEDDQDLRSVQPFVLTSDDIAKYNVKYLGRQKVDELTTYVFSVDPKTMEKGQRYFSGQIWVDDRDLQIVKTYGKAVPDIKTKNGENMFPRFETYREQVDGKYWFPTYTHADDILRFSTGNVRIRMIVRYENYKYFGSQSTIKYEGTDEQPPAVKKNPQ